MKSAAACMFELPDDYSARLVAVFRGALAAEHGAARRRRRPTQDDSLLEWARRHLPDHFRHRPSRMHRWLAARLDRLHRTRGSKLNVLGPRGGAKSTIGSLAYPLRMALEQREPYIWIVSDTHDQARGHLENVKSELESNRRLAAAYPRAAGKGAVWRGGRLVLRNGVAIEAFGTGQRLRGRRRRANRPSLIVCDDIQNDAHAVSPDARRRSRDWFRSVLLNAGDRRTNVIHLATALHREAIGLELTRAPGWTSRVFRAIEKWPANLPLWDTWEAIYAEAANPRAAADALAFYEENRAAMDAGAVVLWPEEEDLYRLMCLRVEGGRAAFEREKQNRPVHPDVCEWPEAYFGDQIWFDRWPDRRDLRALAIALDPSKGADSRRGDYSAFVCLGVGADGLLYVEADLARRPTPQMIDDGVALCRRFFPDLFGVEANQFQELLGHDFADAFRAAGLVSLQPMTIENHVNKRVRIRRLGPLLAGRKLRFLSTSPSTRRLVEQMRDFPIGGHDDGPDALEMACRLAEQLLNPARVDGLGDRLPLGR